MRTRLTRPSPALVVASVALFAALGGTGYAAATGSIDSREIKNSTIQGKDVKNSSLTGKDVKTSGLTGSDVKANSLTGSDVLESKLGKVPSAGKADTATSAGSANTANTANNATATGGFKVANIGPFTLGNNQTRDVLRQGVLTFTARCRINVGGQDIAEILIATSQDNAAFDSNDGTGDLDTTTLEADRQYVEANDTTGTPSLDHETDGTAIALDGTEIVGSELYAAANVLNQPGTCRFGGFFTIH